MAAICKTFKDLQTELGEITVDGKKDGEKINANKVIIQLTLTYLFFCKAMFRDWVIGTMNVYFLNVLLIPSTRADILLSAVRVPFGVKTLWGSLSDAIPCMGYHKRFYILWGVGVAILGNIGLIFLASEGDYTEAKPAPASVVTIASLFMFLTEYGGATCDSLSQARYTQLMKQMGTATIVSFVWFLISSCTLLSAWPNLLVGEGSYKILLYFALPAGLPMLIPAGLNFLQDPPAAGFCTPDLKKVCEYRNIFIMSMVLAIGALTGSVLLMTGFAAEPVLFYYIGVSVVFVIMAYAFLPTNIASPAFYMFLCSALRLYFSSSLQGWYTFRNSYGFPSGSGSPPDPCIKDTSADCQSYCFPDSPGLTTAYYQFFGNFMGAVAQMVAVLIFEYSISKWSVRAAFWVTTCFQLFSACIEITVLQRWNHSIFGTTPGKDVYVDQWFFIIGTQALDKIIEMLDFMPCNVLIGKLCPVNMEATIFAVLAGSQNFGSSVASLAGGIFCKALGLKVSSGNFKSCVNPSYPILGVELNTLSIARGMGGFVLPLCTIPLTFILLPSGNLNDEILDDSTNIQMTEQLNEDGIAPNAESPPTQALQKGLSQINTADGRNGLQLASLASFQMVKGGSRIL